MKPAEPGLEFSCHAYYYERDAVNRQDFLALDEDMKSFITVVVDVADNVRAADHSRRDIMLCFGDWGGEIWKQDVWNQQEAYLKARQSLGGSPWPKPSVPSGLSPMQPYKF